MTNLSDLADTTDGALIAVRGSIESIQLKRNKLGEIWATFVLRTKAFEITCLAFARTYLRVSEFLGVQGPLLEITGIHAHRETGHQLMVHTVRIVDESPSASAVRP